MSYIPDFAKARVCAQIDSSSSSLGILSASNYYLARGDDHRVIATTGLLMLATGPIASICKAQNL